MRGRRSVGVLAIVAAVSVGHLVTSRVPVVGDDTVTPFVHGGRLDDTVHLSYADVKVTDVRPALYLAPQVSTDLARQAGGVWVIVSVTMTAKSKPVDIQNAWLVDPAGRDYMASTRANCAINPTLHTGLETYAVYCFDIPTDRLSGLHFRVARGDLVTGRTSEDDLADVDLAVSSQDETAWAKTTTAYRSETDSLEPIELKTVTLTETDS